MCVLQTLFYTLPRLSCLSDEEWMHPDLFHNLDPGWRREGEGARPPRLLPLYNLTDRLAACPPGPWKMKATGCSLCVYVQSFRADIHFPIVKLEFRMLKPTKQLHIYMV